MDWLELFKTLGVSGMIVTGATFVFKKYFELLVSKDIENFKHELVNESLKFKVVYENLHTERSVVIKELYKKLVQTHRTFSVVMAPIQDPADTESKDENKRKAVEAGNFLRDYFEINKIFLETDLADELELLLKRYGELWIDWEYLVDYPGTPLTEKTMEWRKAWESLNVEIAQAKAKLEDKFRGIIGII